MDIRQLVEEFAKILESESKYKIEGDIRSDKVIAPLETIDLNKLDYMMLQNDGSISDCSLGYKDLQDKEKVVAEIKRVLEIDIKDAPIEIYAKPILTLVGDMSEYSFRLYFGHVEYEKDYFVDFCLDFIGEDENHFNAFIREYQ